MEIKNKTVLKMGSKNSWMSVILIIVLMLGVFTACTPEIVLDDPQTEPIEFLEPDSNVIRHFPFALDSTLDIQIGFNIDLAIDQIQIQYAVGSGFDLDPMVTPLQQWDFINFRDSLVNPLQDSFNVFVYPNPQYNPNNKTYFKIPESAKIGETVWLVASAYAMSVHRADTLMKPANIIDTIYTNNVGQVDTVYIKNHLGDDSIIAVPFDSLIFERLFQKQLRIEIDTIL